MEHPVRGSVPKWMRVCADIRIRVTKAIPFLHARAEAQRQKIGPQPCDRCGQLLGERMYLLNKTRWLFWTEESTKLCPSCFEQEIERLKQAGMLPKVL